MISIIVPVYNVEKYLDRCLDSLVKQTYTDIEIILIDDGSTDGSGLICDKWKEKSKKITVIHQKNSGVSRARNTGLKFAKGEYIGFVDADDSIEEDMYACLAASMNEEVDVAACGYNSVFNGASTPRVSKVSGVYYRDNAIQKCMSDEGWGLYVWNKLFSRKLIYKGDSPAFFPEDLFIGEDAVWLMEMLGRCEKVSYYSDAKYNYISRQGSAVSQSKDLRKIESCKSRYYASQRCYNLIIKNSNCKANEMLRRCVFSSRDVVCECYVQNVDNDYEKWIEIFDKDLANYKQNVRIKDDFLFIVKNCLLLFLLKAKVPAELINLIF